MNIPTTSADDLRAHLHALGVQTADHLTVHSRLLSFGYIDGGVATVFETLREALGPQGTIVVPTYTLSRGTTYDIRMSPSQGVGILPEYIRQLPGVIRSACPMHNHVGLGAKAHVLKEPDGGVSIGPGSDFAALLTANFRLLLLGAGLTEGATFIHHIETLAQVPYRRWLDLPREYIGPDGATQVMTCRYYGRQLHLRVAENFDVLDPVLIDAGVMKRVETHFGASRIIALNDLFHFGMAALDQDPYGLVKTE